MEVPGAEEVNIEMQSSGLSVVVVGVWEIVLDFLQQILHPSPAMKLVDIQAIGNDQKVIPAQMVVCEQCSQSTFRIFVSTGIITWNVPLAELPIVKGIAITDVRTIRAINLIV